MASVDHDRAAVARALGSLEVAAGQPIGVVRQLPGTLRFCCRCLRINLARNPRSVERRFNLRQTRPQPPSDAVPARATKGRDKREKPAPAADPAPTPEDEDADGQQELAA